MAAGHPKVDLRQNLMDSDPADMGRSQPGLASGRTKLGIAFLLAALIFVALWHRDALQVDAIEQQLGASGTWAPVIFIAAYAAATVLFLPGAVMSLAGGALFGPVWGTLWNLAGANLGAALAFLVARYLASDWISQRLGGRLERLVRGVEAEGWRFVALLRLVPLFPFNLVNYALGLTRIRFIDYVLASIVCMVPGSIAYTYFGYAGREALAGGENLIQKGLLALGFLALVIFLPRFVRRMRAGDQAEDISWIESAALRERLDRGDEMVVVDVREPDEFVGALGHISGTRNIPLARVPHEVSPLAGSKDEPVIFVCLTDKRSSQASRQLRDEGFRDVRVLRGGIKQWRANGYPVVGEDAQPSSSPP